jgi:hypothetical protein
MAKYYIEEICNAGDNTTYRMVAKVNFALMAPEIPLVITDGLPICLGQVIEVNPRPALGKLIRKKTTYFKIKV